jgi:hypothetical protein
VNEIVNLNSNDKNSNDKLPKYVVDAIDIINSSDASDEVKDRAVNIVINTYGRIGLSISGLVMASAAMMLALKYECMGTRSIRRSILARRKLSLIHEVMKRMADIMIEYKPLMNFNGFKTQCKLKLMNTAIEYNVDLNRAAQLYDEIVNKSKNPPLSAATALYMLSNDKKIVEDFGVTLTAVRLLAKKINL